jgi:hypothetical protein
MPAHRFGDEALEPLQALGQQAHTLQISFTHETIIASARERAVLLHL